MKEEQLGKSKLDWCALHGGHFAAIAIVVAFCAVVLSTFTLVWKLQNELHRECDDSNLIEHLERHKRSINTQLIQPFILWGSRFCSSPSRGLVTQLDARSLPDGKIVAVHDSRGNVASGAEMMCQSVSNDINSRSSSHTNSNNIRLVNFDHSALGLSRNRNAKGSVHCAFCAVQASSMITLPGKSGCPRSWRALYVGVYVTAGTSQGVCIVTGDKGDAAEQLSSQSILGSPIVTGNSGIFSNANKEIPCVVCAKLIDVESFRGPPGRDGAPGRDGIDGRDGAVGATGARGPAGVTGGGRAGAD